MQTTPITWVFTDPPPDDFPCGLCHREQAANFGRIMWAEDLAITLPLCPACSELSEHEALNRIRTRKEVVR